jgi:hypothetical protein
MIVAGEGIGFKSIPKLAINPKACLEHFTLLYLGAPMDVHRYGNHSNYLK